MSVIYSNCIDCANSALTVEDLLRRAFICDGSGNVYLRVYNPSDVTPACGDTDDYNIETRNVNGVDHDGIYFTHNLNTDTLFFTFTDNNGVVQGNVAAETVTLNQVFIMLDGATGTFCFTK